jgi:predicted anti-sigma-YlaC factor YlaD
MQLMSCRELVELVTEYFEGGLGQPERMRFEEHIAVCPPCREYLEEMRQTIDMVGKLTEQSISPEAETELLHAFRNWRRS